MRILRHAALFAVAVALLLPAPGAWADPPPWAPAHGYRKKGKHGDEMAYAVPFGIDLGRCNRDAIGAVVGGATGAAVGSQIGRGDGRTVATVGGAIIGILVGGIVGRSMDEADHRCTGQIMEHAHDNQRIVWQGSGGEYSMRPGRTWRSSNGMFCRDYQASGVIGGRQQQVFGKACRQADGAWKLES